MRRSNKEEIEAGVKSCLRNATVEVRFVPKENSRILDPKHVMYGDMSENAKITLSVPKLSSGQYVNVLTNEEKAFFEDLFQFEDGAMSIYNKKDNYWDDSTKLGFINTVQLTKRSVFLNLSNPEDYIRYKILLANKNIVAPNLAELKRNHKATYQFVLVESGEEHSLEKKALDSKMTAFLALGGIKDNFDKLKFVVETISKNVYTNNTPIETLQVKAQDYILKNPDKFLEVLDDKFLDEKIILKRGVEAGIVSMRGNYFYLTEGNVPLCGKNQEPTLDVAAAYISLPANQEIKLLIEAKLNR